MARFVGHGGVPDDIGSRPRGPGDGLFRVRRRAVGAWTGRGQDHAGRLAAFLLGAGRVFAGSVRIDPLFQASAPSRTSGGSVTFDPGARTVWHAHPLGQTLIVTSGLGWMQRWGGPVEEIRPGDVVWIPPNVKHWHGATASTGMTHTAIQEHLDGRSVEWMEQVSDEQYRR